MSEPKYKPGTFINFADVEKTPQPKNLKKNGACLYFYTTQENKDAMLHYKKIMGTKTWHIFINEILEILQDYVVAK